MSEVVRTVRLRDDSFRTFHDVIELTQFEDGYIMVMHMEKNNPTEAVRSHLMFFRPEEVIALKEMLLADE